MEIQRIHAVFYTKSHIYGLVSVNHKLELNLDRLWQLNCYVLILGDLDDTFGQNSQDNNVY